MHKLKFVHLKAGIENFKETPLIHLTILNKHTDGP